MCKPAIRRAARERSELQRGDSAARRERLGEEEEYDDEGFRDESGKDRDDGSVVGVPAAASPRSKSMAGRESTTAPIPRRLLPLEIRRTIEERSAAISEARAIDSVLEDRYSLKRRTSSSEDDVSDTAVASPEENLRRAREGLYAAIGTALGRPSNRNNEPGAVAIPRVPEMSISAVWRWLKAWLGL